MGQTQAAARVVDRDSFDQALEQEAARSNRYGQELTLVRIEIDYFGSLNDVYGRAAGNEVARLVEEALLAACRESDTVGSLGGGEFGVLLPECTRQRSLVTAGRVKRLVSQIRTVGLITVSQGIASYPAHAHTPEGLVKAALEALDRSKSLGGDRACRSIRGSLYRSNERRKGLGKDPVPPLAQRRKNVPAPEPTPEPVKKKVPRDFENVSARLTTAKPPTMVVKETWSSKVEAQLRQIATARFAS